MYANMKKFLSKIERRIEAGVTLRDTTIIAKVYIICIGKSPEDVPEHLLRMFRCRGKMWVKINTYYIMLYLNKGK